MFDFTRIRTLTSYLSLSLLLSLFGLLFLVSKLLHGGTDRASPNTTMMWPLLCHEISISYEQEEKVRGIQRAILSNTDGWIHRHTAVATRKVIEGVHDVICMAQAAAGDRERRLMRILTPEQRVKFLGRERSRGSWCIRRDDGGLR